MAVTLTEDPSSLAIGLLRLPASSFLAAQRRTFQYTTLLQLVASLGAMGTYLGHVLGALRDKDAGLPPFGQLPTGVMLTGLMIGFAGTVAVCGTVLAVMTSIHGPTPH